MDKLESIPDIYMFDGNGYLHPRHMGIASQDSFYLNKPTIGVAKTYYRADKKTDFIMPDIQQGSYTDIVNVISAFSAFVIVILSKYHSF